MPLTKEQLLLERVKVISDYPDSIYKIGDIIVYSREVAQSYDEWHNVRTGEKSFKNPGFFKKYPHIFQPLPWWSDRKPEDMPDYLRINYGNGPVLCNVSQWMHKIGEQMVFEYYKNGLALRETTKGTEPITEEEYNAYINQKQQ